MILETIKEHPGYVVGGIAAFVVVLLILNHSGGGATSGGALDTTNSVDAATSLQVAQLGAASQAGLTDAQLRAHMADTAASLDIAKQNFDYMALHDQLAAGVASQKIDADLQSTSLVSTLQAGVQTSAIKAQVDTTGIIVGGQTQQQQILANALVAQSTNQANVASAAIRCTGLRSLFGGC